MNSEQKDLKQFRDKFQNQIRKQKRVDMLAEKRKKYIDMKEDKQERERAEVIDMYQKLIQDVDLIHKVYEWNKEKVKLQNMEQLQQFINQYLESLQRNDIVMKIQSLIILKHALSIANNQNEIDMLIESGTVDRMFTDICNHQNDYIVYEYHWIFANITSGTTQNCQYLVSKNIMQILLNQIQMGYQSINENCLWGISNLVCDDLIYVQKFIDMKGIEIILDNLNLACNNQNKDQYQKSQYLRVMKETISILNIITQRKQLTDDKNSQYIPIFFNLSKEILNNDIFLNNQILIRILSVIQNICANSQLGVQMLVDNQTINKVYDIYVRIKQKVNEIDSETLNRTYLDICRIYSHLLSDTEQNTNYALQNNALDVIVEQMNCTWNYDTLKTRQTCLLSLANVAIGTKDQIEFMLVKYPSIPDIFNRLFNQESDQMLIKEGIIFMMNLASKAQERDFIKMFYTEDVLIQMIENTENYQDSNIMMALQTLDAVFQYGEQNKENGKNMFVCKVQNSSCVYQLEKLQEMDNHEIFEMVQKIIYQYLTYQEEEY